METCRHRDRGAHDVTQAHIETLIARMLPTGEHGRDASRPRSVVPGGEKE